MSTLVTSSNSRAKVWLFVGQLGFGFAALVNGISRIGDGHSLSGWLLCIGGAVTLVAASSTLWLLRSRR